MLKYLKLLYRTKREEIIQYINNKYRINLERIRDEKRRNLEQNSCEILEESIERNLVKSRFRDSGGNEKEEVLPIPY